MVKNSLSNMEMSNCAPRLRRARLDCDIVGTGRNLVSLTSFDVFDFDDDLLPYAKACQSVRALGHSFGMLEAISAQSPKKKRSSGDGKAVYVIGVRDEPDVAKIGVSANAYRRLNDIQSANYKELYLHSVVFTPTRKSVTIEQAVLECAAARAARLQGEWVADDPDFVLLRVLEFCRDTGIPVMDGATWFASMRKRTIDLARARHRSRAA